MNVFVMVYIKYLSNFLQFIHVLISATQFSIFVDPSGRFFIVHTQGVDLNIVSVAVMSLDHLFKLHKHLIQRPEKLHSRTCGTPMIVILLLHTLDVMAQ